MKIVSHILETVEGIANWYIAGLLIFFVLFILFAIRTLLRPKEEMEQYKNAILEDDTTDSLHSNLNEA